MGTPQPLTRHGGRARRVWGPDPRSSGSAPPFPSLPDAAKERPRMVVTGTPRPRSSAGESVALRTRRSEVRLLPWAPEFFRKEAKRQEATCCATGSSSMGATMSPDDSFRGRQRAPPNRRSHHADGPSGQTAVPRRGRSVLSGPAARIPRQARP